MKVLMTGCTCLQVGQEPRLISKINVPKAIVALLRELGHEVDWRTTEVGEPVEDRYDLLFLNIAPMCSLNGRPAALGALWALSRRLPTIVHFDDWKIDNVFNDMRGFVRRFDRQIYKMLNDTEPFYLKNFHDPELRLLDQVVKHTAEAFSSKEWTRWLAMCPMYGWGDKKIVLGRLRGLVTPRTFSFLDPTPLVIESYETQDSIQKQRRWAMASLMKHPDWLAKNKGQWPVDLYGTSREGVREGTVKTMSTEEDVKNEYARHWGILSPEYPQSGSGWFRSRFVYAAQTGSVLYCGMRDGASLGESYQKYVSHVESLDDTGLALLAQAQADALRPHLWTKERFVEELNVVIKRAQELA